MAQPFDQIRSSPLFDQILDCSECIAKKRNISVEQVAVMWVLQKQFVTSCVLSVSSVDELEEMFNIFEQNLSLSVLEVYKLNILEIIN